MSDEAPVYDSSLRPRPFVDELVQLLRYRNLLRELISRDIKMRYKRSLLGVGWTMLHPLLTMAIMTFVFSAIFRFSIPHYPVYLLSGLLVWNFFTTSTTYAMSQLVWGGGLLNRIYLPKASFAVSAVGTAIVNLVLAVVPLLVIMLVTSAPINWTLAFLPVPIVLLAAFSLGVGLFMSSLAVYFGDALNMYEVLLTMWMYATPIFYPIDIIPARYQWVLKLNPMYHLVQLFRWPTFAAGLPPWHTVLIAVLVAGGSILIGWWFFTRKADEYAYRV